MDFITISLLANPEPTMTLPDPEDTAEDLGFIAHRSTGKSVVLWCPIPSSHVKSLLFKDSCLYTHCTLAYCLKYHKDQRFGCLLGCKI